MVLSGRRVRAKNSRKRGKRKRKIRTVSLSGPTSSWSSRRQGTQVLERQRWRHVAGPAWREWDRGIKVQDGRVSGKASQPTKTEGMLPSGFDLRFDVALLRAGESLPPTVKKKPGPTTNLKPSVTSVFEGDGRMRSCLACRPIGASRLTISRGWCSCSLKRTTPKMRSPILMLRSASSAAR